MKKTSKLIMIFLSVMLLSISCTRVAPNYAGVLMENYGKSGKSDYSIVSGRVSTIAPGTELFQTPLWEQRAEYETKSTLKDNIYSQANNVPAQFIKADTSMFGTQSETIIEMKKFYTEQTVDERSETEDTLTYLGFPCKIIPIIDINVENEPITLSI